MKKLLSLLPIIFLFCCSSPQNCGVGERVLVSIAPHKYLVDRLSEGSIPVHVIVPAGASPHSYEPKARDMVEVCKAKLWFITGEPFESQVLPRIKEQNSQIQVVDILTPLPDLIYGESCCDHHHHQHENEHDHGSIDNHVWVSPRLYIEQAQLVAAALSKAFPENKEGINKNLQVLKKELLDLDTKLKKKRESLSTPIYFLASHPAFAYFARDYDLIQLSVEQEGREPQPKEVQALYEQVQKVSLSAVLLQEQYNNKGAILVAEYINSPTYTVNPYSENVPVLIEKIGDQTLHD
jgi:zinc transport system substrate-binding protein